MSSGIFRISVSTVPAFLRRSSSFSLSSAQLELPRKCYFLQENHLSSTQPEILCPSRLSGHITQELADGSFKCLGTQQVRTRRKKDEHMVPHQSSR